MAFDFHTATSVLVHFYLKLMISIHRTKRCKPIGTQAIFNTPVTRPSCMLPFRLRPQARSSPGCLSCGYPCLSSFNCTIKQASTMWQAHHRVMCVWPQHGPSTVGRQLQLLNMTQCMDCACCTGHAFGWLVETCARAAACCCLSGQAAAEWASSTCTLSFHMLEGPVSIKPHPPASATCTSHPSPHCRHLHSCCYRQHCCSHKCWH